MDARYVLGSQHKPLIMAYLKCLFGVVESS